jgi:hypothetical protein
MEQALEALENVNPSLVCEMAHHPKKDQHGIGQKCPLEIRHLETITALKAALEQAEPPPEWEAINNIIAEYGLQAIDFVADWKAALEQPAQEPVAYDKTEMNSFVIDLYEEKMKEGKHGHYEAMFHCVHQAIARVTHGIKERNT